MNEFLKNSVDVKVGEDNLIFKSGHLARQANGAVTVQYGDTVVLVSAVISKNKREGIDFFPLFVEYREQTYAAGKIPGGFIKREGRPREKEILTSRLIDRPIRPLFPDGFLNEIQIMALVLSADKKNDPDLLAVNGASAALAISDIPFEHVIGSVRVSYIDEKFVVNPTHQQVEVGDLDLVVTGTEHAIMMIEGGANQLSEEIVIDAIEFAHGHIKKIVKGIEKFAKMCGKEKIEVETVKPGDDLIKALMKYEDKLKGAISIEDKSERKDYISAIKDEVLEGKDEDPWGKLKVSIALENIQKNFIRDMIIKDGKRMDGRGVEDLRDISCEVGVLPRTHGSAVFTRGQTQALAVTTLGTVADEQRLDELRGESTKSFMLHYNFPPFSVGEIKPIRGPGRREIGHGALAEKSLKPILPKEEGEFPYTIRIVSDILESNGSSSMASVCGGSLCLMDAGVPISDPVAGISIGLILEKGKHVLLTDIIGEEDHFGDMDFKVAGTKKGITGVQLDIKVEGLTHEILKEAIFRSKEVRMKILEEMGKALSKPREDLSSYAPKIVTMKVKKDKIREVIGPGGKVIKGIIEETGAEINIDDDGTVSVASPDQEGVERAIKIISDIVADAEVGKTYKGKVKRVVQFGAFVEVLPGKEGLVHISQLADHHVKKVEDVVKVGDEILVKVMEIDGQGRINLSKKAVSKGEGG